jgi:hypothetical protein
MNFTPEKQKMEPQATKDKAIQQLQPLKAVAANTCGQPQTTIYVNVKPTND